MNSKIGVILHVNTNRVHEKELNDVASPKFRRQKREKVNYFRNNIIHIILIITIIIITITIKTIIITIIIIIIITLITITIVMRRRRMTIIIIII